MNLKTEIQKLYKLKYKEKIDWKKENEASETCETVRKYATVLVIRASELKKKLCQAKCEHLMQN